MKNQKHSLKKRFSHKLLSNLVKFSLGFVTIGIIPRALGPELYGNYGFLTAFYARVTKFLKLGITTAYCTKLSARPDDTKLIGFYFYYVIFFLLILFFVTFVPVNLDIMKYILPDQDNSMIYYAAIFAGLQFVFNSIQYTQDSLGNTVLFEKIYLSHIVISASSLLFLYNSEMLTLNSLFQMYSIINLVFILIGLLSLKLVEFKFLSNLCLGKVSLFKYLKEFFTFSHPLFIHGIIVFFTAISDRWLLQLYHGSTDQGYFTLAFKIAGILFLFSSAIITVLSRDFSHSFKKMGKCGLKNLFVKYFGPLFFLTSFFSIFVSTHADFISILVGGESFSSSSICVSIIVLYPIHQVCGQILGSIFLAMEKTKVIRNIGLFVAVLGFLISLIIIPSFGFNIGSVGLSFKLIIVQFLLVNIYFFMICKYFQFRFINYLNYQLSVIIILFILSISFKLISNIFLDNHFLILFSCGTLFTLFSFILLIIFPKFFLLHTNSFFLKNLLKSILIHQKS